MDSGFQQQTAQIQAMAFSSLSILTRAAFFAVRQENEMPDYAVW